MYLTIFHGQAQCIQQLDCSHHWCRRLRYTVIYIEEAHAEDAWRFENNIQIKSHTNLAECVEAAQVLHKYGPKCPIVVDDISDEANLQYGGLYERLYIVLDDVIVYQGERRPMGYRMEEVEEWLEKHYS